MTTPAAPFAVVQGTRLVSGPLATLKDAAEQLKLATELGIAGLQVIDSRGARVEVTPVQKPQQ